MAIDYVLLRPRRKDKVRQEFCIVLRKEIKATQHKKLGLYDPNNGRVEEWCYKEDYEHFSEQRKSELDQG
jgi:hypothetical protein